MVIRMEIKILNGHHRSLYKRLICQWKETWTWQFTKSISFQMNYLESYFPRTAWNIGWAKFKNSTLKKASEISYKINPATVIKTYSKLQILDCWQAGWGLNQRRWSNDACATPQWRPSHELAWIWTDFLSEKRQATDFVETAGGRAANGSLHDARARLKTQISSQ